MTGIFVASLVLVGPIANAIFSRMPEPPQPPEMAERPEPFGPSRRLFELDRALR